MILSLSVVFSELWSRWWEMKAMDWEVWGNFFRRPAVCCRSLVNTCVLQNLFMTPNMFIATATLVSYCILYHIVIFVLMHISNNAPNGFAGFEILNPSHLWLAFKLWPGANRRNWRKPTSNWKRYGTVRKVREVEKWTSVKEDTTSITTKKTKKDQTWTPTLFAGCVVFCW